MDSRKFLQVPKEVKGKSLIPLPRLSRISTTASKSRDSRSSSSNRALTLIPQQLFSSSRRSRSCTSLRDGLSTPVCRSRTPTTPSSSKYLSNNKEWVTGQLGRVRNFLLDLDPELPPLKPLNSKTYIRVMNLLWNQVDSRITISEKNKQDIAEYLKMLKFPCQIKSSVLRTPTVPHNFPYILTIWSWLLDIIEVIHNPNKILELPFTDLTALQLHKASLSYLTSSFMAFNNAGQENNEDESIVAQKYREMILGVDTIDIAEAKEVEANLEEKLNEAKRNLSSHKEERDKLQQKVENEKQKYKANCSRKKACDEHKQELLEKMDRLKKELHNKKQLQTKLKGLVKNQPCTKKQLHLIEGENRNLTYNIQLKKKRENEQNMDLPKMDIQLDNERQELLNVIDKINSRITLESQWRPELEEMKIRETGFLQQDMLEVVNQFVRSKKDIDAKLTQEQESQKITLMSTKKQEEKDIMMVIDLMKKKEELKKEENELANGLEQLHDSNEKKYKQYESQINGLEALTEDVLSNTPNMEEFKIKEEQYSEEYVKLIQKRNEIMKSGEQSSIQAATSTATIIKVQKELANQIVAGVNKHNAETETNLLNMLEEIEEILKEK